MKDIPKKIILAIALIASPMMLTGVEDSHKAAAAELLDVCKFEKTMGDAMNATIDAVKQMDPKAEEHEESIRKFYEKYMSGSSLRKDMISLYCECFTEKELKDITSFYRTESGQKSVEAIPELMQKSMQLAQSRVMKNIGELQSMISEEESTG